MKRLYYHVPWMRESMI